MTPLRFHVAALPHTRTSKEFCACAYTQKILNFSKMMLSLGHEVYHYGAEGSDLPCTEHIQVISAAEQQQFFGEHQKQRTFPIKWDAREPYWQLTNCRTAEAINRRKQKRDFLCIAAGNCQQAITALVGGEDILAVEPFVGYYGIFSRFRAFESYTHQSVVYGTRSSDPDGALYDAVIPNYYDPDDFPLSDCKRDYLLYMGRLIHRKGLQIALDTAKRTGRQLILVGQGVAEQALEYIVTEEGMRIELDATCEYRGTANVHERAVLMGRARAVLMPTMFMEPFGGVAVEAQLCGTPVITTDHAAFSETVKHNFSGYRCHTLEQFCWAAEHVDRLASPAEIRDRALRKYSIETVKYMYKEWFEMLLGLWGEGWPSPNPRRTNLDWLDSTSF